MFVNHIVEERLNNRNHNLQSRMNQLIYFLKGSKLSSSDFVEFSNFISDQKRLFENDKMDQSEDGSNSLVDAWALLEAQIYLFRPFGSDAKISIEHLKEAQISSTDRIIYRVILDMAEVGKSPKILDKMRDAHLFCISIANSHPHLILRHLPLLSRLLRGRTHHDFKDFKDNRHLDFFTNFAGILIILGKKLFIQSYRPSLIDILGNDFTDATSFISLKEMILSSRIILLLFEIISKMIIFNFFEIILNKLENSVDEVGFQILSFDWLFFGTNLKTLKSNNVNTSSFKEFCGF